jgi:DNA-binding CsgD family transcriptional regulator
MLTAAHVEVAGCMASTRDLGNVVGPVDVVVVHVGTASSALALGELCSGGARVVGVHDTLSPGEVGAALAGGVATMVDTSAAPAVFLAAVAGTQAGTRLRWSPPTIGPMPLTVRERSVLALVAAGRTSFDVAAELGITTRTVEAHKKRIFERLGVQNQAHAVAVAVRAGLLEPASTGADTGGGASR